MLPAVPFSPKSHSALHNKLSSSDRTASAALKSLAEPQILNDFTHVTELVLFESL